MPIAHYPLQRNTLASYTQNYRGVIQINNYVGTEYGVHIFDHLLPLMVKALGGFQSPP